MTALQITETVLIDSAGMAIRPSDFAHTFTYNGDGTLATDSFVDADGHARTQTFTYTGGKLTGISAWVRA
jgi:hypothetical protein